MTFRVGQKVVCVNDKPVSGYPLPRIALNKGSIYTVRKIHPAGNQYAEIGIEVIEAAAPVVSGFHPSWAISRFRPLIERKTDTGMAILRKLLDGNKIEEKV